MAKKKIGFVGLGHMGGPMAARLVQAQFDPIVFDINAAAVEPLRKAGARVADSFEKLSASAEIVFACLPTPDIVKAVALHELSGGAMRVFVDLSTTGSRIEREVAAALAAKGVVTIDCPVSGGVAGARNGTLALIVAGKTELVEELRPALDVLGKIFYVGTEPGMAQIMKVINNISSFTALAITSEAMVLGAKAGLDADVMVDVMNASSGRNTATTDKFPRAVLPRSFDFGFAIGLSGKDISLCLQEAEALGVPMVVGAAVRQLFGIAARRFGPEADMTNIVRLVEEWAGAEVRGKSEG